MNWKNWPYWVRGWVIGFIMGIAYDLFLLLEFEREFSVLCTMGSNCPSAQENFIANKLYLVFFSYPTIFSLVGTFISYLYGKFKNRKRITGG